MPCSDYCHHPLPLNSCLCSAFISRLGAFIGAFLVLVCASVLVQLLVMVKTIVMIARFNYLREDDQESILSLARAGLILGFFALPPVAFAIAAAIFQRTALEYLFTLLDIVLGVILIWFIVLFRARRVPKKTKKYSFTQYNEAPPVEHISVQIKAQTPPEEDNTPEYTKFVRQKVEAQRAAAAAAHAPPVAINPAYMSDDQGPRAEPQSEWDELIFTLKASDHQDASATTLPADRIRQIFMEQEQESSDTEPEIKPVPVPTIEMSLPPIAEEEGEDQALELQRAHQEAVHRRAEAAARMAERMIADRQESVELNDEDETEDIAPLQSSMSSRPGGRSVNWAERESETRSSMQSDSDDEERLSSSSATSPTRAQMRRVSIADTHL